MFIRVKSKDLSIIVTNCKECTVFVFSLDLQTIGRNMQLYVENTGSAGNCVESSGFFGFLLKIVLFKLLTTNYTRWLVFQPILADREKSQNTMWIHQNICVSSRSTKTLLNV